MTNAMEIRESIKRLVPARMLSRPVDHRGYPVPWFVTVKDDQGRWEFRIVAPERLVEAIKKRACWICGEQLGRYLAFAVGPMCGINRTSGEPPQHLECAEFAVRACPFMLLPKASRREAGLGEHRRSEYAIRRNPAVSLIWSTESYRVVRSDISYVFRMGEPTAVSFWKEGRRATRAEIDESIDGGLPALTEMAALEGAEALALLAQMKTVFESLLPAA